MLRVMSLAGLVLALGFAEVRAVPVSALHSVALAQATAVQAQENAEFVLKNETPLWLSLFIDGKRTVSVPPGDRGVVLVTPGNHNFKAVTLDGTNRSATRSGHVSAAGITWTITMQN